MKITKTEYYCDRCGQKMDFVGWTFRRRWIIGGAKYDMCVKCHKEIKDYFKARGKNYDC